MIAISLSPNTQKKDYIAALKLLFSPTQYLQGKDIKKLENWFKKYFLIDYAISFDSGRSAEFAILSSLGIKKGDEVLIQAFTCVAVPNSILWTGAKPIYVDIEKNSFNMDPKGLEPKISKKAKAIIIQHTFGIPAKIAKIKEIAQKFKLILIEDCAHSLGATIGEEKIGTLGNVAFFSFGRDKVVSGVFGGMVITNNQKMAKKISEFQKNLSFPSNSWVVQQLLHPIFFSIILPTYTFLNLGKIILFLAQKLHLLSLPVKDLEKKGERPTFYPKKLPNSLAKLALLQLERLESFNTRRKTITKIYLKELKKLEIIPYRKLSGEIFLRFPILVEDQDQLLRFAKKRDILLGDWYSHLIDPKDVDLKNVGYTLESCPVAEEVAKKIVNLPTYPRMKEEDVKKVIEVIKEFYDKNRNYQK